MKKASLLLVVLVMAGILACNGAPKEAPTMPPPETEATEVPTDTPMPPTPVPTATREPTPTQAAVGLSISNPVPVGQTLVASNGAAITIHGIGKRDLEALQLTKQWNQFNDNPGEGMEYVLIEASVGYEGNDEETLEVLPSLDFRVVVDGNILEAPMICCAENKLEGEMFPGGLIEGPLVFEVPAGATDMIVIYTVLFEQSYYLATQ